MKSVVEKNFQCYTTSSNKEETSSPEGADFYHESYF